jgi:hypothetical protein
MTALKSRYTILSNKTLTKTFDGALYEIDFKLPSWFKNWNGKKIIKVYGCSFRYLESENKEPILSSLYANQFLSVHSNIARDETEHLPSYYKEAPSSGALIPENDAVDCFMMIVNNYYTPKIYDVSDSNLQEISIWFKDSFGNRVQIRGAYTGPSEILLNLMYQAVFKIECELAIL